VGLCPRSWAQWPHAKQAAIPAASRWGAKILGAIVGAIIIPRDIRIMSVKTRAFEADFMIRLKLAMVELKQD
jgi:hypothetical protein